MTADPAAVPPLRKGDVHPDPMVQLARWWEEAGTDEMTVATIGPDGIPAARVVLLRGLDDRGLVFFTNYRSAKGTELEANPHVALVLRWPPLRQVRVVGTASRTTATESDAYWAGRPRESQLSAVASAQSEVLADRAELEAAVARVQADVGTGAVPRPAHWGGYRVTPSVVELWQQGEHRLHDRLRYRRTDEDEPGGRGWGWVLERLAP